MGGAIAMIDIDSAHIEDTKFKRNVVSTRGTRTLLGYGGAVFIEVLNNTCREFHWDLYLWMMSIYIMTSVKLYSEVFWICFVTNLCPKYSPEGIRKRW